MKNIKVYFQIISQNRRCKMELKFKSKKQAIAFQKQMKTMYGYKPALFHFPDENKWMVVKPKGLKKIR